MPHPVKLVSFPEHPDQLDHGQRVKELHSPYGYEWTEDGVRHRLTAPEGFTHNGASVPRIVWSFYPPHPLDRAAVFHDLHYQRGGVMQPGEHEVYIDDAWQDADEPWTRKAADVLFKRLLDEDPEGPGRLKRHAAYRMVRFFGRGAWLG